MLRHPSWNDGGKECNTLDENDKDKHESINHLSVELVSLEQLFVIKLDVQIIGRVLRYLNHCRRWLNHPHSAADCIQKARYAQGDCGFRFGEVVRLVGVNMVQD